MSCPLARCLSSGTRSFIRASSRLRRSFQLGVGGERGFDGGLVIDDLLHGQTRAHFERLGLDLNAGDAVDQKDDIVALKTAPGVNAKLADSLGSRTNRLTPA